MKQGWEIKKLGEICDFGNGLWKGKKPPFINVGVVRNTNFTKEGELDDSDIVFLEVEQSQFAKRKLKYGDIILEKSGGGPKQPVGRVIVFNKKEGNYSFSNFTSVIRINSSKQVDFTYLHRFLFFSYISGVTERMQSHSTGIRNLKFDEYKDIKVPLPPLSEQQRIVAILDEAFASIVKAKANAEQNLKNVKELFESICNQELWQQNKNCPQKKLAEIVDNNRGGVKIGPFGSALKIGELVDKGDVRVLYIENIVNNKFDWEKEKYITNEKFDELRNYEVFSGDVLITIMGTIGRTAIVPENLGKAIISSHLIKITLNQKLISSEFLNYSLNSNPFVVLQLFGQAKGAIMKGINSSIIKNLIIPLPAIKEQSMIVKRLHALNEETKRLETIYRQKLNDLEELKKSLLTKAFNGELKTA